MKKTGISAALVMALTVGAASADDVDAMHDGTPEITADDASLAVSYNEDGRYYNADDLPTYNIAEDGTVDWMTYSGFRRYHSECHVCHGPDGEGSTYAPKIKYSAVNMDYYDFYAVVAEGRKRIGAAENSVMPAFGDNPNVMCYLQDIYVYLLARGVDAVPRGRPGKKEAKSDVIREDENACLG